jgi:hypothetical protein
MTHIRRYAAILAGLIGTITLFGVGAPAAFAQPLPPEVRHGLEAWPVGGGGPADVVTVTRTVIVGGMAGWQIALIAIGAALLAAAAAISADRARRRFAVMPA